MARITDKIRKATRRAASKAEKVTGKVQRAAQSKIAKARRSRALGRAGEAALLAGAAAVAGAAADEALRAIRRRGSAGRLGFEVRLAEDHAQAIMRVTEALKEEGFGILTRIDVHVTLKEKIGVDFRPYTILGACNPPLAYRAISAEPETGLLLPCNVTVEHEAGGGSLVRITDPVAMLQFGRLRENPVMGEVATEATERLNRVRHALEPHRARVVL